MCFISYFTRPLQHKTHAYTRDRGAAFRVSDRMATLSPIRKVEENGDENDTIGIGSTRFAEGEPTKAPLSISSRRLPNKSPGRGH
jgi:hypothetical protein